MSPARPSPSVTAPPPQCCCPRLHLPAGTRRCGPLAPSLAVSLPRSPCAATGDHRTRPAPLQAAGGPAAAGPAAPSAPARMEPASLRHHPHPPDPGRGHCPHRPSGGEGTARDVPTAHPPVPAAGRVAGPGTGPLLPPPHPPTPPSPHPAGSPAPVHPLPAGGVTGGEDTVTMHRTTTKGRGSSRRNVQ